jgi:hypothetical protein
MQKNYWKLWTKPTKLGLLTRQLRMIHHLALIQFAKF